MSAASRTPLLVGKSAAYIVIPDLGKEGKFFGVGICVYKEKGYREVATYVPRMTESLIQGIVDRLNSRIGVNKEDAAIIVASTFGGRQKAIKRSAPSSITSPCAVKCHHRWCDGYNAGYEDGQVDAQKRSNS